MALEARDLDAGFAEFYRRDYERVVSSLSAATGDANVARELVDEAVARAWNRTREGERIECLGAWVRVVARNLSHNRVRRARVEARRLPVLAEESPVDDLDAAIVVAVDVQRAIELLPPRQREMISLRYFDDLSINDIAETLTVEPATVKSTLRRARVALAATLGIALVFAAVFLQTSSSKIETDQPVPVTQPERETPNDSDEPGDGIELTPDAPAREDASTPTTRPTVSPTSVPSAGETPPSPIAPVLPSGPGSPASGSPGPAATSVPSIAPSAGPTGPSVPTATVPSSGPASTPAFDGVDFVVTDADFAMVSRPPSADYAGMITMRFRDERTNPAEPIQLSGGLGVLASGETRTLYVGAGTVQFELPSRGHAWGIGFRAPPLPQPAEFAYHLTITTDGTNLSLPYHHLAVGAPVAHGDEASYDPTMRWTAVQAGSVLLRVNRPNGTTGAVIAGGQTFPLAAPLGSTVEIQVALGHQIISLVVDGRTQHLALWGFAPGL